MNELPHYPSLLQRENSISFELMGSTIAGGQTASGVMPLARLDGGGLWKATFSDVAVVTADHVRTWRALAAICDGGVQPLIVPLCDKRQFPAPLVGGVALYSNDDVPHSDDAPFSDLSEYTTGVVSATLDADAALRDTSITIDVAAGGDLQGGEHFSIDHDALRWRLYRIGTAIDNGDGTFDCTIRPPLRAAVVAGTPLEFDEPKCVMRLASPSSMDLTLQTRRYGRPSVEFIEAFPPFPIMLVTATPPPSWLPRADGELPTLYAEPSTEGGFNHYWYAGAEYSNFAEWLAALGGTFTGSANGTRVNAAGLITQAVANTPRFDYNPSTLAAKGILLEGARTNLTLRSQEFDNAAWTKDAGTTITANNVTGPDGALTADKVAYAGSANGIIEQTVAATTNTVYTGSFYIRADAPLSIYLFMGNGSGNTQSAISVTTAWQRISLARDTLATANISFQLESAGRGANPNLGAGTVYVWGAQIELGSFASSYIPTTTVAVTRAADSLTFPMPSGTFTSAGYTVIANAYNLGNTAYPVIWDADLIGVYNQVGFNTATSAEFDYGGSGVISTTVPSSGLSKVGIVVNGAAQRIAANGGAVVSQAVAFKIIEGGTVRLGQTRGAGNLLYNSLATWGYFPVAASNAELQRLTT